jgi:transcription elongation factor GreB
MSKAFTRETDDAPERPLNTRAPSPLPPGSKNYITARGVARLQRELKQLSAEPATEAARQRTLEIERCLSSATVVAPPPRPWNRVLFGATVTVRNRLGDEAVYHIVGQDESDADRNFINWYSPLAKALLKAHVGERVHFRTPTGEEPLEITRVRYE